MRFPVLIFLLIFVSCIQAQVTIEPFFPTVDDDITVYFDATQGTGGLKDCNCTVYTHTGVITSSSTGPTDWKYVQGNWGTADPEVEMIKVSDNIYSISYNIREFYGIPAGEEVYSLAFVFRNTSGSLEGKALGGTDIYYDLVDPGIGLAYIVLKPGTESRIVPQGTLFDFQVVTSVDANIDLKINGNSAATVTNEKSLSYQTTLTDPGSYVFDLFISDGQTNLDTSFIWTVPGQAVIEDVPADMKLGFNYFGTHEAVIVLEAPNKGNVFLVGNFSDWRPHEAFQMNRTADGQFHWLKIDTTGMNGNLQYQFWFEDGLRIADPLSFLVLDPDNDRFIEPTVFPNLPEYPTGKTVSHISYVNMYADYDWQVNDFQAPPKGNLVVYEMLIRDFVQAHNYLTLIDTLDYLQKLGVNAIELMPVNEFEGNISWGYNPSFHMALDKYYGTPEHLKAFVDACHARGIAVLADVVFNHGFGQNPLVRMYWDATTNKPAANSPYANPDAKHPFNVGYDFNHESASTKRYVKRIIDYYLSEYRFDGFRFDLSKGLTQKQTNDDSQMRQYDASRIAILKDYATAAWSVNPNTYVILEHFAENSEEIELSNFGMMLWGNLVHDYAESSIGNNNSLNNCYYKTRNWTNSHLVSYMESHDEERMAYRNQTGGKALGNYNIKDLRTGFKRQALASAFFYTVPGPKMLWQFGELGYDYPINYCENGTINNACRTSPKPIRWDYQHDFDRLHLYGVTSSLIHLKTQFPEFEAGHIVMNTSGLFKSITMDEPNLKMKVIGNFDLQTITEALTFPSDEWYYNYLGTDSILGHTSTKVFTLQAGEYKVWLNKKTDNPWLALSTSKPDAINKLAIFPNPVNGDEIFLNLENLSNGTETTVEVLDFAGIVRLKQKTILGDKTALDIFDLLPGNYLVRLVTDDKVYVGKFVKI